MTGRQRILATVKGDAPDRLAFMPITMMFAARQAGHRYRDYVSDHRVLAEAQVRTARRFEIDHVSAISDPAREACDCGAAVTFFDDQPPAIDESRPLLEQPGRLATLRMPDPHQGRMGDRVRGVRLLKTRAGADRMVEGWVEGPCAQGANLRGLNQLMLDLVDDVAFVEDLFAFVIEMETAFARAQVAAGADVIGIGDAAASLVGPELYRQLVWPREKILVDRIIAMGAMVRLHICGDTRALLADMGRLGCPIVDLDHFSSLAAAREAMGAGQVLLGNIDPVRVLRNSTADQVGRSVARCHREAGARFIVGAGCEVPPDTPDENLLAMLDYARSAIASGRPAR
jgi:MtaA/CmuA family methyltransferase